MKKVKSVLPAFVLALSGCAGQSSQGIENEPVLNLPETVNAMPVIFDGDMGGDDAWAILTLLGHPEEFNILGISTVFGNVDRDKATHNACDLLAFMHHLSIPVYAGESSPLHGKNMLGDNAYGEDGFGGVNLGVKPHACQSPTDAVTWITKTLEESEKNVTIFVVGPFTNMAKVLQSNPALVSKIDRIIAMGGGIQPGPNPDILGRSGNITEYAEFNFFQDPYAVNVVAQSGVKIYLLTLDSNHHMALDSLRKLKVQSIAPAAFGQNVAQMLDVVAPFDKKKFGMSGPAIHDPNTVIYALEPDLYRGKMGEISVEENPDSAETPFAKMRRGKLHFMESDDGNVRVLTEMTKPDKVFEIIYQSLSQSAQSVYNEKNLENKINFSDILP